MAGDAIDAGSVEVLEGVLRAAHITQANQAAIRASCSGLTSATTGKDQVLELLNRLEIAVDQDRKGCGGSLRCWWTTDRAADHDLVLSLEGIDDIHHREVETRQLLWINP